jgi:hypothetical protein
MDTNNKAVILVPYLKGIDNVYEIYIAGYKKAEISQV